MDYPKISVIVPSKANPLYLEKCIISLFDLDYPNFDVIIIDDGLNSEVKDNLKKYKDKIKILESYSKGPSFARNIGAKNTDAEFIAFTDSDCIVDKKWLKELLEGFKTYPEIVACGGMQKLPPDATDFEKKVFLFMKKAGFVSEYVRKIKSNKVIQVEHNPSYNVMYRKDIFLKEGAFLEGLWPGEDTELDYRLIRKGHKLVFNPKAIVYHYKPKTLNSFLKMMYRYGYAQAKLIKKYGFFRRIHFVPFISFLLFLFIIFLFFYNQLFLLTFLSVFLLGLFFYFNSNFKLLFLFFYGLIFWQIGWFTALLKQK